MVAKRHTKSAVRKDRLFDAFRDRIAAVKLESRVHDITDKDELESWDASEVVGLGGTPRDASTCDVFVAKCGERHTRTDHEDHVHDGVYYVVFSYTYHPGNRECPPETESNDHAHVDSLDEAFLKAVEILLKQRLGEWGNYMADLEIARIEEESTKCC